MYMKRDKELMRVMNKDSKSDNKSEEDQALEDSRKEPEKPFLVQKTNDYLQSLRKKWEEKEQELLAKDKDIHYQDLLFDEARIHGVGYYAFSTDETERQAQMEELKKQREETLRKQKEAEEIRKERDALMAARVAAARQRQRARQGLPPLPDTEQQPQKDFTTCLLEFLTQQRNEADAKANEAEIKRKEEQEKERQKLREAYVREWDIGKEGVGGDIKKFREMTQEEYVEQQRAKRIDEFAPPQTATSSKNKDTNTFFDDRGSQIRSETPIQNKTWSDVRPVVAPLSSDTCDIADVPENKGLYFTTAKKNVKYKNFVKVTEPTPIVNEVSDEEGENNERTDKRKLDNSGAEIEPPATYEYYGPTPRKTKPQNPYKIDVREAYAQGAKSLESKSSNIKLPEHYDFTFD
ncbi:hypothetical protein O3G_MSEX012772 [Manduca sexta]|uniref:Coiled-coil domain-containing protein 174 n=1 Tax=Manduca sexta TaxID=7130 RepID=A0A921ZPH6_MANSE|nr:hypothetical protein O3G_MSEX012772 [Manduca sexta]